ncbi:MAG: hypothetical protein LBI53_08510 [Candidatus Peribacteria bacterium]|nr:hypothetical protein [Candidatus Peribacteria bacterium]
MNINNPGLEDQLSKNYSRIHFNAGGNDFGGTIFRFNQLDPTGDIIEISGDDTSIYCSNQMRGLYHNSQR